MECCVRKRGVFSVIKKLISVNYFRLCDMCSFRIFSIIFFTKIFIRPSYIAWYAYHFYFLISTGCWLPQKSLMPAYNPCWKVVYVSIYLQFSTQLLALHIFNQRPSIPNCLLSDHSSPLYCQVSLACAVSSMRRPAVKRQSLYCLLWRRKQPLSLLKNPCFPATLKLEPCLSHSSTSFQR